MSKRETKVKFEDTSDLAEESSTALETPEAKRLPGCDYIMPVTRPVANPTPVTLQDPIPAWRHSGRTTAMLAKAWQRADKGDSILVVVPDSRMIPTFKAALPASPRVDIATITQAHQLQGRNWDAVFIDHSAWEEWPFETARFLVTIEPRVKR